MPNISLKAMNKKMLDEKKKSLIDLIDILIEDRKKRQITKPIEKMLRKYASGEKRGGKTNNVHKFHSIATNLKNTEEKVRTFKQFKEYKPEMIYLKVQVFISGGEPRLEPRQHLQHKTITVPADHYILEGGVHYIGDANGQGQAEQWQYVAAYKGAYDRLLKKEFVVHDGRMSKTFKGFGPYASWGSSVGTNEVGINNSIPLMDVILDEYVNYYIQQINQSKSIIIIIRGIQKIPKLRGEVRDAEHVIVTRAISEKKLINKYLQYDINPLADSLEGLFEPSKYFKSNSCLPCAILNWIADKYNAIYKKKKIDYKFIWDLLVKAGLRIGEYDEKDDFPMTFHEAKLTIFKMLRQEAFLYHENGKLLAQYHPKDDNLIIDSKIRSPLRMIMKDEHVYLISNSDSKRSIALKEFSDEEMKDPSIHYNQSQAYKQSMGAVTCLNDAIYKALPIIKEMNDDEEILRMEFILNNPTINLLDIFNKLMENSYVPYVQFNGYSQISRLSMKINNAIISLVPLNFGSDTVTTVDIKDMTDTQATRYQEMMGNLNHKFTAIKYRSSYAPKFKEVLNHFNRCPEVITIDGFGDRAVGIDNVKCYPSIVAKEILKIPVFSEFDLFKEYNNEKIGYYNLYLVERNEFYNHMIEFTTLLNKKYDVVYGFILQEIKEYVKILSVCVPYKLVKNDLDQEIIKLFADDVLSEKMKKQIAVSAIGKFGISVRSANKSTIHETIEDAYRNKGENEKVIMIDLNKDNKQIFVVQQTKSSQLIDGFLPIQRMIYDLCRLKISNLIKSLPSEINVLGCKTDCVFIPEDQVHLVKYPWKGTIDAVAYENMGKWALETIASVPYNNKGNDDEGQEICRMRNKMGYAELTGQKLIVEHPMERFITRTIAPTEYILKNEYSLKEVIPILRKENRLLILGLDAGSGKSYMCEEIIKHYKNKSHFVACPQNPQALKWQKNGFTSGTLFDLCGKSLEDEGANIKIISQGTVKEADIIVFEECGQYSTSDWAMVSEYLSNHPKAIIIANGDLHQNEPIDDLNENIDEKTYYINIRNLYFRNQIILHIPKRYKDEETRDKAIRIRKDLFENNINHKEVLYKNAKPIKLCDIPTNAICLSYLQDTRRDVNNYMHFKQYKEKYFNGLRLKANTRMNATVDKKKYKIHKNFEYIIKNFGKTKTIMYEELNDLTFEIETYRLINFSYCHAFTGHSYQGETVKVPVVIFDYKFYHVTSNWMYPALTRNEYLDIYYCDDIAPTSGLNRQLIVNKIKGYKSQDMNAGRPITDDYIDVPFVFYLSKKQKHCCKICKSQMNYQNVGDGLDWVVDRLCNNDAHLKNNTQLLCINCNSRKK